MALTYSSMLELGSKMPHFELKNVMNDKMYASTSFFNKKPSLIMVICNHCPYVIHYHEELKKMNNDQYKSGYDFNSADKGNGNTVPGAGGDVNRTDSYTNTNIPKSYRNIAIKLTKMGSDPSNKAQQISSPKESYLLLDQVRHLVLISNYFFLLKNHLKSLRYQR